MRRRLFFLFFRNDQQITNLLLDVRSRRYTCLSLFWDGITVEFLSNQRLKIEIAKKNYRGRMALRAFRFEDVRGYVSFNEYRVQ